MPEHKIRLRAAWDAEFDDAGNPTRKRLDLPVNWPPDTPFPARLRRAFNTPRLEQNQAAILISCQSCWGVSAIWLDGQLLFQPDELANSIEFQLPSLTPSRHVLQLDLDQQAMQRLHATTTPSLAQPWGEISLLLREL